VLDMIVNRKVGDVSNRVVVVESKLQVQSGVALLLIWSRLQPHLVSLTTLGLGFSKFHGYD